MENIDSIFSAIEKDNTERLKQLLGEITSHVNLSDALAHAASKGCIEHVTLLLPYSYPPHQESIALQWAAYGEHMDIVDILFPLSNAQEAIDAMKRNHVDVEKYQCLVDLLKAQDERLAMEQKIGNAVCDAHVAKGMRKI